MTSVRNSIANVRLLRRIMLPALRRLGDRDITLRHHLTGTPLRLHAFRHKTYWFYGAKREAETLAFISRILKPGMQVVDVGAHIGYMSAYFANLVGEAGRVIAFEPGANNLPYLRANLKPFPNVTLVTKALSDLSGTAQFLLEDLSGLNNSLVSDSHVARTSRNSFVAATVESVEVETVTLDSFCSGQNIVPNLVKIDAEEAELMILRGMRDLMSAHKPALIIEVWDNRAPILELLFSNGYRVFNSDLSPVHDVAEMHTSNAFCV
jgi:FkbM family methyltransferase